MKKINVIHTCLFVIIALGSALPAALHSDDNKKYNVANIPESLRKDADAVIRNEVTRFEVKSEKKAVEKVLRAVTIFNKDERDRGELMVGYDKFSKIEEFEGTIYDASGEKVRELEDKDIKDYSAITGYSLYEESRVKYAELYYDKYPYTIEFSYEISYHGYLGWPGWTSRSSIDPVEHSSFEVLIDKEQKLRSWCNIDSIKPVITDIDDDKRLYVWEASNLPKLSKDAYGDYYQDYATIVSTAPTNFEVDGKKGDMHSWRSFGLWNYNLYMNKSTLPESAIKEVHALIKPGDSDRDKIDKLYKYMQARTRYVSVQLGIGGWEPFNASYVHERGYGDCKALTNYMLALLKEVGIPSYPVVIRAGHYRYLFVKEFPSQQFNHVILCVPMKTDTVWLECTNQSAPVGKLGDFTENRGALMLQPEGGVVVNVPRTFSWQNTQIRRGTVTFTSAATATADISLAWCGDQEIDNMGRVDAESPLEREKWVTNSLHIPNASVTNFKFSGIETRDTTLTLAMQLDLPKYASVSGNRMFLQPNILGKRTRVPSDVEKRFSSVMFDYPYQDSDTIMFKLPAGFSVEALPSDVQLTSSFGAFSSKTKSLSDTILIYTRSLEIKDYEIPAKNYQEYRKFFSDVVKADRAQVVLVRKRD